MQGFYVAAICILATISTVSSQCCDFDVTICGWNYGPWETSDIYSIDYSPYPNFVLTEPSPYFMFIQNNQGPTVSTTQFNIPAPGTVISFDYFFDVPSTYSTYDYMTVSFYNADGTFATALFSEATPSPIWQHQEVSCVESNGYCCGSLDKLPCYGTIQITAYLDPTNTQGLFAIDNIGTSCTAITTQTTSPVTVPTLPPPAPAACCLFDLDVCGVQLDYWYWSAQYYPVPYIPSYSGNFIWTSVLGAQAVSYFQYNVNPTTTFSVEYYISSPTIELSVYFINSGTGYQYPLATLYNSVAAWTSASVSCGSCCGGGTCNGQLLIRSTGTSSTFVAAVDNAQTNSACSGSFPCCYFDDSYACGFSTGVVSGYSWRYSGLYAPSLPIPPTSSGTNYVFFEANSYAGSSPIVVNYASPSITISMTTVFDANIYIYNQLSATKNNYLAVSFTNQGTGLNTQLDYVKSAGSGWLTVKFACDSTHGNCCQGYATCTGQVILEAHVDAQGGVVQYGVDAFGIDGQCSPFPGGAKQQIKFFPTN